MAAQPNRGGRSVCCPVPSGVGRGSGVAALGGVLSVAGEPADYRTRRCHRKRASWVCGDLSCYLPAYGGAGCLARAGRGGRRVRAQPQRIVDLLPRRARHRQSPPDHRAAGARAGPGRHAVPAVPRGSPMGRRSPSPAAAGHRPALVGQRRQVNVAGNLEHRCAVGDEVAAPGDAEELPSWSPQGALQHDRFDPVPVRTDHRPHLGTVGRLDGHDEGSRLFAGVLHRRAHPGTAWSTHPGRRPASSRVSSDSSAYARTDATDPFRRARADQFHCCGASSIIEWNPAGTRGGVPLGRALPFRGAQTAFSCSAGDDAGLPPACRSRRWSSLTPLERVRERRHHRQSPVSAPCIPTTSGAPDAERHQHPRSVGLARRLSAGRRMGPGKEHQLDGSQRIAGQSSSHAG